MEDVQSLFAATYEAQRKAADKILSGEHTHAKVVELARDASIRLDSLLASLPDTRDLACRAKCSWCCYERVACSPPEVIAVAAYVQTHLVKRDRAQLTDRLSSYCEKMRGLSTAARDALHVPCPLLADGLCLAHKVRPLVCRCWHSYDAAQCKRHLEGSAVGVSVNKVRLDLRVIVSEALNDSLRHAGLARPESGSLDLAAAARLVLAQPDPMAAWLRGEDPFEAVGYGERSRR